MEEEGEKERPKKKEGKTPIKKDMKEWLKGETMIKGKEEVEQMKKEVRELEET